MAAVPPRSQNVHCLFKLTVIDDSRFEWGPLTVGKVASSSSLAFGCCSWFQGYTEQVRASLPDSIRPEHHWRRLL